MSVFPGRMERLSDAYEKYADLLYRIALSHLGRVHDAEDAVADAFAKYLTSPVAFAEPQKERAWLIRVTVNRCLDMLRRRKLRDHAPIEEAEHLEYESSFCDEVSEVLSKLPENLKAPVVLHFLEGFSLDECSKILGISLSAVKMRIMRAKDMLRSAKEDA